MIPPTRAAASITTSGLASLIAVKVASRSRRSSSEERQPITSPAPARSNARTNAEPTRPLCPATYTFLFDQSNATASSCHSADLSPVPCGARSRWGKLGNSAYCAAVATRVLVVEDESFTRLTVVGALRHADVDVVAECATSRE